jgi:antitoxin component YwqK of YwqJK toxin-antitoxin module
VNKKIYISYYIILSLKIIFTTNHTWAISKNPECYTSSEIKITFENLRQNEDGQFLFNEPTNYQFRTWGRVLKTCQYSDYSDIKFPIYMTFDSGNERGQILDGYKQGTWIEYFDNTETIKSTGNYIDGNKDGKWVEFDKFGQVINEVKFVMGETTIKNETISDNKQLIGNAEVIVEKNTDNSDTNLPFENLLQINGIYFDPLKNIPVTIEYKSGSYKGKITNGYINAYPDTWTKIDESGNIEYIGYFKNNNRDGVWIFYQNNSIYEQGSYSEGLKTDFWIKYYPNGNVLSRGAYTNDKEDGPWVYFNEDGSVLETGSYNNGIKTGPWVNLVTGTTTNY